MKRLVYACLTGFVLCSLVVRCAQAAAPEASIRWAERLLARTSFEKELGKLYMAQWDLRNARDAFNNILAKYGRDDARAWVGLARAQAGLGQYAGAVESNNKALSLEPDNPVLKRELTRAKEQQAAARAASAVLPKDEAVILALPYPACSAKSLWAMLSAKVKQPTDKEGPPWPTYTDSHLTLFEGSPDSLRQVWRSGVLGYPGHTQGEFNDIYLYVRDVTGDGCPDLVILEIFVGASWIPSHIDIFTWRNGKAVHLLGAVSDEVLQMKDLAHDGRYEVITDHAVGSYPSHAEQPRWISIYAYKNGIYQHAEGDFPSMYRDLYKEIRVVVRRYPNDPELPYYLGRVYEIRHNPRAALRAYKRAEKVAAKLGPKDAEARRLLEEIRVRMQTIGTGHRGSGKR